MNTVLWLLAGSGLGWAAYSYLNLNAERGMPISVALGGVGGLIGGKLVAPAFVAAAAVPGEFSSASLFFAAAVAAGLLYAGNLIHNRWGV